MSFEGTALADTAPLAELPQRRLTYQERRDLGLCVERCCAKPPVPGRVRCAVHLAMVNRSCAKIRDRRSTQADVVEREQRLVEASRAASADATGEQPVRRSRKVVPRSQRLGNSMVTRDAQGRVIVTKIA